MTINELKKKKILSSGSDEGTFYANLLDVTLKIAKEQNRSPEDVDIQRAIKKLIKENQKAIQAYMPFVQKDENAKTKSLSLEDEINFLKQYQLPQMSITEIELKINSLTNLNRKEVISYFQEKHEFDSDMSIVMKLLNNLKKE